MKKINKFLSLLFVFLLAGCGEPPVDINTLPAAEQPAGAEIRFEKLPYAEMRYNSTSLSLESIDIYQLESNYEYSAFVVASYDISMCSDEDRHWLFEQGLSYDNDFDAVCYMESDQNDIDFDRWNVLHRSIKENTLYYIFYKETVSARHDFSDAEITFVTTLKQEERDKNGRMLVNEYTIHCNGEYSNVTIPIKDVSEMPSDIEKMAIQGIEHSKETWKSIIDSM